MSQSLGSELGFKAAQAVTTADGMVRLVIKNLDEPMPMSFVNWVLRAEHRALLRMIGGTSIPDADNKRDLINMFDRVARRRQFLGAFMSGGTRMVDEDFEVDPMITEIPGVFKRHNPRSIALGTCPRTADYMTYRGPHSSFFLNDNLTTNTLANPDLDCLMVVQLDATEVMGWDGDVEDYFKIMEYARDYAGFQLGTMTWNGGGVSAGEVKRSLKGRIPTLLLKDSGRIADGLVECRQILIEGGTEDDFPDTAKALKGGWLTADAAFEVVERTDDVGLEGWMDHHGLLVPA